MSWPEMVLKIFFHRLTIQPFLSHHLDFTTFLPWPSVGLSDLAAAFFTAWMAVFIILYLWIYGSIRKAVFTFMGQRFYDAVQPLLLVATNAYLLAINHNGCILICHSYTGTIISQYQYSQHLYVLCFSTVNLWSLICKLEGYKIKGRFTFWWPSTTLDQHMFMFAYSCLTSCSLLSQMLLSIWYFCGKITHNWMLKVSL